MIATNQNFSSTVAQDSPKFPMGENHLSEKQLAAIELLVLGKGVGESAKLLNIDRKTLYNWRQEELFQETLRSKHDELWNEATERLRGLVHPSLDVLEQHLADRYDRARFRAASTILRLAKIGNRGGE